MNKVPRSLSKYLGTDFDSLIPSDDMPDEEDENYDEEIEYKRKILQECLEMLDGIVNGASIYRAIKVDDLRTAEKEKIRGGDLGQHWTSEINIADINYNYCSTSKGYSIEDEEPHEDWMDRSGVMILEAKVIDPSKAINFNSTIYLYMENGEEESEVNIGNDSYVQLVRIGLGSTTGRARKDLRRKQEEGITIQQRDRS